MPRRRRLAWKGSVCGFRAPDRSRTRTRAARRSVVANGCRRACSRRPANHWPGAAERDRAEPSDFGGTHGSPKTSSGTEPRNGSSNFNSSGPGLPGGFHVGVFEEGGQPRIGLVHDGAVGPFEIEGEADGFADTRIGELRAARVEVPALRAHGCAARQFDALDAPILYGGKIIGRCSRSAR